MKFDESRRGNEKQLVKACVVCFSHILLPACEVNRPAVLCPSLRLVGIRAISLVYSGLAPGRQSDILGALASNGHILHSRVV